MDLTDIGFTIALQNQTIIRLLLDGNNPNSKVRENAERLYQSTDKYLHVLAKEKGYEEKK
jgi:hypothetical protein